MIPNEKVMLASDLADKIADFEGKVGKHDRQVLHNDSLSRHQRHSGKKSQDGILQQKNRS